MSRGRAKGQKRYVESTYCKPRMVQCIVHGYRAVVIMEATNIVL